MNELQKPRVKHSTKMKAFDLFQDFWQYYDPFEFMILIIDSVMYSAMHINTNTF